MKNVVFIPNINNGDNRNKSYYYSVMSWKHWCDKNNAQCVEWDTPIADTAYLKITLQRYWVHEILAYNNIEYNQVLIVDADTIVHPDCPNFFNETNNEFSVVLNNGCYEWTTRSIKNWGDELFPNDQKIKPWKYFNGGFQITNKTHIDFYNEVKKYYTENSQLINDLGKKIKAGTDQTVINYLAQKHNIKINYLPECYNLQDLFRKNLLHIEKHSWFPNNLLFLDAGWVYHFNAIPQNPRHVNYWMERTYKELYEMKSITLTNKYSPISLDYFLNMEVASGGESKTIMNLNGKLKTVRDIVDYWKTASEPKLTPSNWQYYNCMMAGFKKSVSNHHDMGWDKMTQQYYDSLEVMTDLEIEQFLKETPVDFDNGFIKHGYHRAYAMIGRLIRDEKYIPFYMETKLIYDTPSKFDGIDRVRKVTDNINKLNLLTGIDKNEYCLTQSSILAAMGIRANDDLDIIVSGKLKNTKFDNGIEVISDISKYKYFGAKDSEDLIKNFTVEIDGYKFLEPRFYFARKNINQTDRDITDWILIKDFFNRNSHLGYPFNFDFYKWGLTYVNKIQLSKLELNTFTVIRDKYDRVVDNVNHGRSIYFDKINNRYIKIFNPKYCRLNNFHNAVESGVLNGVCSALTDLIYDGELLIGYITEGGDMVANNDTEFDKIPKYFFETVLKNCKKRFIVYYDFVPANVVKLKNNQYSLIDLESFYKVDQLSDMQKNNAVLKPHNLLELIESI